MTGSSARLPPRVTVYEVGPRDGLQNEPIRLPPAVKVELVERLASAGLPAVEVTSFVSPRAVPQLADAREVFRAVRKRPGVRYPVLVPNMRGYEAAREAGAGEIAVFTAATETFNLKNIGCGIDRSFDRFGPVLEGALRDGVLVRGYVSTAFVCPYEGKVSADTGVAVARRLFEAGCTEVSVGDTIGAAVPTDVHRWLDEAERQRLDLGRLALHFHDTRGTALTNVMAGLARGISTFDSACGGLGGCPFAPGAAGNLPTEDLLFLLEGMGIETGVDLDAVRSCSLWLAGKLEGRQLPSRVLRAGRPVPAGRA